jgi:hypothetical protein
MCSDIVFISRCVLCYSTFFLPLERHRPMFVSDENKDI